MGAPVKRSDLDGPFLARDTVLLLAGGDADAAALTSLSTCGGSSGSTAWTGGSSMGGRRSAPAPVAPAVLGAPRCSGCSLYVWGRPWRRRRPRRGVLAQAAAAPRRRAARHPSSRPAATRPRRPTGSTAPSMGPARLRAPAAAAPTWTGRWCATGTPSRIGHTRRLPRRVCRRRGVQRGGGGGGFKGLGSRRHRLGGARHGRAGPQSRDPSRPAASGCRAPPAGDVVWGCGAIVGGGGTRTRRRGPRKASPPLEKTTESNVVNPRLVACATAIQNIRHWATRGGQRRSSRMSGTLGPRRRPLDAALESRQHPPAAPLDGPPAGASAKLGAGPPRRCRGGWPTRLLHLRGRVRCGRL